MDTNAEPEQTRHTTNAAGPPIRRLFRDVIADRMQGPRPPQAAMLFDADVDPCWDDRNFLGDFCSEILHQDTCQPATADGLALVTALAVDDRVPARHRFHAVDLLFRAATVAERHLAETWPATPQHADPDSEARARSAVQAHVPTLLARWPAECPAVRLALAGLAVVFPTDRTLPALTPRLRTFTHQHPQGGTARRQPSPRLECLLLPSIADVSVLSLDVSHEAIRIDMCRTAAGAACPDCGSESTRVHISYLRFPADVPSGGRLVVLQLRVRRFFCPEPACARLTFAEQMPGLTRRHSRWTERLRSTLAAVGLALAGRAGARMARAFGVPISRSALFACSMLCPNQKSRPRGW